MINGYQLNVRCKIKYLLGIIEYRCRFFYLRAMKNEDLQQK